MTKYSLLIISAFCATLALAGFMLANDVERCEQRMSYDACMILLAK